MESLLILLISFSISSLSAFTPPTTYFLSCGSNATITFRDDYPSRSFTPDSQVPSKPSISTTQTLTNPTALSSTSPSLYTTARLFIQPFTYNCTVNSIGTHVLRLHFSPFTTPAHNLSSANFNISALQTFLLLASFSPSTTIIKEYFLWVDAGEFQLTFTPNSSPPLAFINTIELFTAPPFLIDNTTEPKPVSQLGNDLNIDHLTHQALETIYRINVGGPKITPATDTLWRTWTPDDDFLVSNATTVEASTTGKKNYLADDPRSTCEITPEYVYSTAREMNISNVTRIANSNFNFNFNMTWIFLVPPGYRYFVRFHFCDIVSELLVLIESC